jgi:hypothetical protein
MLNVVSQPRSEECGAQPARSDRTNWRVTHPLSGLVPALSLLRIPTHDNTTQDPSAGLTPPDIDTSYCRQLLEPPVHFFDLPVHVPGVFRHLSVTVSSGNDPGNVAV